jgi:hypothetical protein
MTGCRIGRVKIKGGADLTILERPEVSDVEDSMLAAARAHVGGLDQPTAGYVVVTWSEDCSHMTSYQVSASSPISHTMLPSFVADAIRRLMVENGDWPVGVAQ